MPPINSAQKATLNQFMSITGLPEKTATKIVKGTGWKLDQALNSFYESSSGASAQSKERDSLGKLFETYRASTDEDGTVTIDGMMQYFGDLGVNIETAEVLVPVEIIQAPAMGTMTKDGFIDGWRVNGADTITKQKAYLAGQIKQLSSDMTLFKRVYRHTFIFAKEKDQKALPKDTAVVYWDLLFKSPGKPWVTSSTNWIEMWIEFLGAKWNKSVNKDMWNQTFEFFLKTMEDETLGFWSEDGAWPGVIDDFVAYVKEKRGDVPDSMETD